MKKLIYFSIFIIAVVATAQTNRFPPINWYPGDPTGTACTVNSPLLQSQNYGFIYGCNLSTLVYGPVSSSVYGYLPLTGGTMTGALNGTSAAFSSNVTIGNTITPIVGTSLQIGSNVNGGQGMNIQNTNTGANASVSYGLFNSSTTHGVNFNNFAQSFLRGSGFVNGGIPGIGVANTGGFECIGVDCYYGTYSTNPIHFVYNNADAFKFDSSGFKIPGIAAGSGTNCLQVSASGLITNTGSACGSGGGGGLSGMTTGQIPVAATSTTVTSSIATTGSGNVMLNNAPAIAGAPTYSSYAVASASEYNSRSTAGIGPVTCPGLVAGADNTSAVQACASATGPIRYTFPDTCSFGVIKVTGTILFSVNGTDFGGNGGNRSQCPTIFQQQASTETYGTFTINCGYLTPCYDPPFFHDLEITSAADLSAGAALYYCAGANGGGCNLSGVNGGTGARIKNVYLSGHPTALYANSFDSFDIEQSGAAAATTSSGPLNIITGQGHNSDLINQFGGTCSTQGGSTPYATEFLQIGYGLAHTIKGGESSYCAKYLEVANGVFAAMDNADFEGFNSIASTTTNGGGIFRFLGVQGGISNATTFPYTNSGGNMVVQSVAAVTGGTPLTIPTAGSATTTTGTLTAGTYGYRICATNAATPAFASCTPPSTEETCTLGSTGGCVVNWSTVTSATGYCIYGNTVGAETQGTCVTGQSTATWTDSGGNTFSGAMNWNNHTAYPIVGSTSSSGITLCSGAMNGGNLGGMQQDSNGEQVICDGIQSAADNGVPTAGEYTRGLLYRIAGRSGIANDDLGYVMRTSTGAYINIPIVSALYALQSSIYLNLATTSGNIFRVAQSGTVAGATPLASVYYTATSGSGFPLAVGTSVTNGTIANFYGPSSALSATITASAFGIYNPLTIGTQTVATSSAPSSSNKLNFTGNAWNGSASNGATMWLQNVLTPSSGTTTTETITLGTTGYSATNYAVDLSAANAGLKVDHLNLIAARKGTFVCTSGGSIVVSNTNGSSTSDIIITLKTSGGTLSTAPMVSVPPNGTQFTALCATLDTSTYNYLILD